MLTRTALCRLSFAAAVTACLSSVVSAQWLNYPTKGVPRTADGKPDMSAPAPRTADGKPDLSGMWGWDTPAKCGAHCNDLQISREFLNIAATLKDGPPYQAGRRLSRQEAHVGAGRRPERPLYAARRASDLDRRLLQADRPGARSCDHPDRTQYAIPTDLHGWTSASRRSESDVERLFERDVGRRHTGCANLRVSRRPLPLDAFGHPLGNSGTS